MMSEQPHAERNEDNESSVHPGYAQLQCPICKAIFIAARTTRMPRNCGRVKCNLDTRGMATA